VTSDRSPALKQKFAVVTQQAAAAPPPRSGCAGASAENTVCDYWSLLEEQSYQAAFDDFGHAEQSRAGESTRPSTPTPRASSR
jgi:hypothetical protein